MTKVTIAIRTYNEGKDLEKILPKIYSQKKVPDFEVLLIDSKSTDSTQELIKKYGLRAVYIDQKNFTHAWTFNLGAEYARGEIVVYTSAHVIINDDLWLHDLVKHFDDPRVAGVFGRQLPIKGLNYVEEFKLNLFFGEREERANFSNANGAIRRSVWLRHRYNENVPLQYSWGEDQKWIQEVKKDGYRIVYEPLSEVYHSHKPSLKSRLKSSFNGGYYEKECAPWNQGVYILSYKKIDLINYLLRNRHYWTIVNDLFFQGLLIRIATLIGKIKRKIDSTKGAEVIEFYKLQEKKVYKQI